MLPSDVGAVAGCEQPGVDRRGVGEDTELRMEKLPSIIHSARGVCALVVKDLSHYEEKIEARFNGPHRLEVLDHWLAVILASTGI